MVMFAVKGMLSEVDSLLNAGLKKNMANEICYILGLRSEEVYVKGLGAQEGASEGYGSQAMAR